MDTLHIIIYSTQACLLVFDISSLFLFKPIHQFSDDKMFDLERDAKEGHLPDFEERKKKRIVEVRKKLNPRILFYYKYTFFGFF